jgi:hypothetical protein
VLDASGKVQVWTQHDVSTQGKIVEIAALQKSLVNRLVTISQLNFALR